MQFQQVIDDPIQRTSTPVANTSSGTHDENPYYSHFRSKLDVPMTKGTLRGIYGPKQGLINGHLVMKHTDSNAYNRNYTYVMRFSKEFSSRCLNDTYCDNSQSNVQQVQQNQQHMLYSPRINVNAYYAPSAQTQPISKAIQQLTPMYYLPVKYR